MKGSRLPSSTLLVSPISTSGAQILDARLVEHVRADLVAPAHVALGVFQNFRRCIAFVEFQLVHLRLEHLHGRGAVLVLAALVLAGDDDARGSVRQAHRRFGLVDVLAAGAARTVDVHLDVGRVQVDLDVVVDFRRDEHRRERGVAAIAGIERRLAHQPMHAGLGAQPAIGVVALDLDGGALHARDFARLRIDDFGVEAARRRPLEIHAQQHLRPVLRLGAARARLDVEEGVVRIHLAAEHALEFELAHVGFELARVALDFARHALVVLALGEIE